METQSMINKTLESNVETLTTTALMAESTAKSPDTILPEELMIEILSRVESSDTLQLRCVSKLWKSLILNPQFLKKRILKSFTDITVPFAKALKKEEEEEAKQLLMNAYAKFDKLDEEEKKVKWLKNEVVQFDYFLLSTICIKENCNETMRADVQTVEDSVKYLQSYMRIYINSAKSSSSTMKECWSRN